MFLFFLANFDDNILFMILNNTSSENVVLDDFLLYLQNDLASYIIYVFIFSN